MSESYMIGDAGQAFDYIYLDEGGTAVSLAGANITFRLLAPSGAVKVRVGTLIELDTKAQYILNAVDLDEEGVWFRQFTVAGPFADTTGAIAFYVGQPF